MTAAAAQAALGAELWMVATGGSLAQVGELLSVNPPKVSRGTIDASNHDTTGGKRYIQEGLYDGGEISGQIHLLGADTNDALFHTAVKTGGLYDFKVVYKGASAAAKKNTFSGFVTEYGGDTFEIDGKQTASFTIKIDGSVTDTAADS